jgi:hydrogenase maturation protease
MTLADVAAARRLLIYGIGNVGRQDDGLGVHVVERLQEAGVREGVTLEANYQLTPEDALTLSAHDSVVFIDATIEPDAPEPYELRPVLPAETAGFGTHALDPASVLALCERLYHVSPVACVMAIPGYAFDVNAGLSGRAASHLERALADLRQITGRVTHPAERRTTAQGDPPASPPARAR